MTNEMKDSSSANLSLEEKLKAIITAQCEGGYSVFKECIGRSVEQSTQDYMDGFIWTSYESGVSILQILLDNGAAKALWGDLRGYATHRILDAWHSGNGNNWKAAIDTGYDLLPNKDDA